MAATRLAQARIEALKANGADIVCWDGELTGFGVRVRKSYVLQPCVRGKMRRFTVGQRGRGIGRVERDSNRVENRIRPVALTKKNALLASHDGSGSARGRIASLVEIA